MNGTNKPSLFEYVIIWHPNPDQEKDGKKSCIIADRKMILAKSHEAASMAASMDIPADKKNELDQIQICVRPF